MVLAIVALAYNPETQEVFNALVGTETGEQVNSAVRSLQTKLAPVVESVQQAVSPYIQRLYIAGRPTLDAIRAQYEVYAEQLSTRFAAILQQVKARVPS